MLFLSNTAWQIGPEVLLNPCCSDRVYQGCVAFAYFPMLIWKDVISVFILLGIPLQCALKHSTFLLQFESLYDTSIISNTWAEQIEHILLVEFVLPLIYWFI